MNKKFYPGKHLHSENNVIKKIGLEAWPFLMPAPKDANKEFDNIQRANIEWKEGIPQYYYEKNSYAVRKGKANIGDE